MIRSRLHKLLDVLRPEDTANWPQADRVKLVADYAEFRLAVTRDPLYIFDDDIVSLLVDGESSQKSMNALAEAGLMHIPYPAMTVQLTLKLEDGRSPFTWFHSLREREDGVFLTRSIWLHESGRHCRPYTCEMIGEAASFKVDITSAADEREARIQAQSAGCAIRCAVLMTHIQGLDREHVPAPAALNKQRERSGKGAVHAYNYIHVGRVLDSEGRSHERGGSTGRHMPVHMRAGHNRRQHYGEGNTETKIIWIPPVLVNYKAGEREGPVLERRVIR